MLIHRSSAAIVRISPIWSTGAMRSPMRPSASMAATPNSRGTRNSDWSSSPLLGVKARRKCGSRSCHGPGTPSCSVVFSAAIPGTGWRGPSASRPPSHDVWPPPAAPGTGVSPPVADPPGPEPAAPDSAGPGTSARCFCHTRLPEPPRQSVKTLTL